MRSGITLMGTIASALLLLATAGCKEKKKDPAEKLWPILPFLQSQAAGIDTSLFSIRKFVLIDSLHSDTQFISRDEFREAARDFLSLPDISDPKFSGRYKETSQFEESMGQAIITHLPVDPAKELIQRQEVMIKPDPGGDRVTNIIINTSINNRDSAVQKKMLWQVDKGFQVTTIRQLPGQPETISTYKVAWNE